MPNEFKQVLKPHLKPEAWLTVRIGTAEGRFLGPGRVELLEHIQETGSINKAARAMKMSYKKAWEMIHEMNEQCKEPLVISKSGGEDGGGTQVTEKGLLLIREYRKLVEEIQAFAETKLL
jgi:molybdate transport system regulatory protein